MATTHKTNAELQSEVKTLKAQVKDLTGQVKTLTQSNDRLRAQLAAAGDAVKAAQTRAEEAESTAVAKAAAKLDQAVEDSGGIPPNAARVMYRAGEQITRETFPNLVAALKAQEAEPDTWFTNKQAARDAWARLDESTA